LSKLASRAGGAAVDEQYAALIEQVTPIVVDAIFSVEQEGLMEPLELDDVVRDVVRELEASVMGSVIETLSTEVWSAMPLWWCAGFARPKKMLTFLQANRLVPYPELTRVGTSTSSSLARMGNPRPTRAEGRTDQRRGQAGHR
jgi:hypothetical protein